MRVFDPFVADAPADAPPADARARSPALLPAATRLPLPVAAGGGATTPATSRHVLQPRTA